MIALDELKKLPIEERMQIVEELTRSIDEEADDFEASPELIEELERRHAEYLVDPSSALPMEEAFKRIRAGREQ